MIMPAADSFPKRANPEFSVIEIEQQLKNAVVTQFTDLLQAFRTFDVDNTQAVTKGEFRRVLELFCLPMTTNQFESLLAKVDMNRNGTVRYRTFLDKFSGKPELRPMTNGSLVLPPVTARIITPTLLPTVGQRPRTQQTPQTPTAVMGRGGSSVPATPDKVAVEELVQMLRIKICANPTSILKAFRLFDYNRDRKIQRHEMRKVLDNYCFQMSNSQFDRFWQRITVGQSTTIIDYIDFLRQFGVNIGDDGQLQWSKSDNSSNDIKKPNNHFTAAEDEIDQLNIGELEQDFRKKIRSNFGVLKKSLQAFDPNLEGFVGLSELHSVLNQFVFPMSRELFQRLMNRLGLKATGKIAWLTFLEKFQDPQAAFNNGSTIPIRSNHKCNPIRGTGVSASVDQLLELLWEHVNRGYANFRAAFLDLDKKRKGRIARADMRRLMTQQFKLDVSEEQFRELMTLLDPRQTGHIHYHQFLKLFEPRETAEGHKWLKSVHRVNDHRTVNLAWDTVEQLLREKLTRNWPDLVGAIKYSDPAGSGFISPTELRKLIDRASFPLADEHFSNILSRLSLRDENGQVNYLEFLSLVKVDIGAGLDNGLAERIIDDSLATRQDQLDDLHGRMSDLSQNLQSLTGVLSLEDVMVRLKDRIAQHRIGIRDAFNQYDSGKKGKISRSDFRKMLTNFGLLMSDAQFEALCSQLGYPTKGGGLDYTGFVSRFEDNRPSDTPSNNSGECHLLQTNHKVNPIRGDQWGMTAEQVEEKMRIKLRDNFSNLRQAFEKLDGKHQGHIDKASFRTLLDSFMCITTDSEFGRLCEKLKINETSAISYQQFLDMFQMRDSIAEGHKWLVSQHRWNPIRGAGFKWSADDVRSALPSRIHQHWHEVGRAFCHVDQGGQGWMTKRDLAALVSKLEMSIEPDEFKKLWKSYDLTGRGAISYADFLRTVGVSDEFGVGDVGGTSSHIIQGSHEAVAKHLAGQRERQDKLTESQAALGVQLTTSQILMALRRRVLDSFQDVMSAFKTYDHGCKGYLDVVDIQQLLTDQHFFVSDEQLMELVRRLGLETAESSLTYEDFCKAFEDKSRGPRPNDDQSQCSASSSNRIVTVVEATGLTAQQAEGKVREAIGQQLDAVAKTLRAFDGEGKGRIRASDFRRVIDAFCMRLTDAQFQHLLAKCVITGDACVDYIAFLSGFAGTKDVSEQMGSSDWLLRVSREVRTRTPLLISGSEVESKIHETVQARPGLFADAFHRADYAKIGVISKQEFREIISQLVMRLTDDQFDRFWANLPVNEFGNVDYQTFLIRYGSDPTPTSSAAPLEAPDLPSDFPLSANAKEENESAAKPPPPAVVGDHLTPAERQLRECIATHWMSLFERCRRLEEAKGGGTTLRGLVETAGVRDQAYPPPGHITVGEFQGLLNDHGVRLTVADLLPILARYNLTRPGPGSTSNAAASFNYQQLMRTTVAASRQSTAGRVTGTPQTGVETVALVKRRLAAQGFSLANADKSRDFFPALSQLRRRLLEDWKAILHELRSLDPTGSGSVSPGELRRCLAKFGWRVGEDEFYNLVTHFDRTLTGRINYNHVVRTFLATGC